MSHGLLPRFDAQLLRLVGPIRYGVWWYLALCCQLLNQLFQAATDLLFGARAAVHDLHMGAKQAC